MTGSFPYMKFYCRDWRGDQALRACSIEARGLWIEMIFLMHEGHPYGRLTLNESAIDPPMLSKLVNVQMRKLKTLLDELESLGVFSRNDQGVIFCRRMVRDHEKAATGRESANRRWTKEGAVRDISDRDQSTQSSSGTPTGLKCGLPIRSPIQEPTTPLPDTHIQSQSERYNSSAGGALISATWRPTQEASAWCTHRFPAYPMVFVTLETEKFINHWISKAGTKAVRRDWDAAWKKWMLDARPPASKALAPPPSESKPVAGRRINKTLHPELFAACERVGGKPGIGDEWWFPESVISVAAAALKTSKAILNTEICRDFHQ